MMSSVRGKEEEEECLPFLTGLWLIYSKVFWLFGEINTKDLEVKVKQVKQGKNSLCFLCEHKHSLNCIKGERQLIVESHFHVVKH